MAKSRSIGSTYVELMLKDVNFKKGLATAEKSLNKFAGGIVGLAADAAKAMAVVGVAITGAMIAGTKRTLANTDALVDMANQTGVAVADMMILQRAYEDGGRSADMAGKDIGKMQKSLVTAQQGGDDPFKALGLSADELLKKNPAEQMKQIGEAIMRIQNPAQRTAKAMEIFGKGGMGLLTVFGGMGAAEKALGRMPRLAEKFGSAMGEANDLIGHLPIKSDQFFMGFTAGIIGELLPGLQLLNEKDFTELGKNLGDAVATGINVLTNGSIWEVFRLQAEKIKLYLQTEFLGGFINTWAASISTVMDAFSESSTTRKFSFGGNFDEHSQAGLQINKEKNEELDKRIAELLVTAAKKAAERSEAVASGVPSMLKRPIDTLEVDKITKPTGKSWERMSLKDEYQSRGLSTTPGAVKVGDKMLTIMEAIHAILDRAELEGGLVWQ